MAYEIYLKTSNGITKIPIAADGAGGGIEYVDELPEITEEEFKKHKIYLDSKTGSLNFISYDLSKNFIEYGYKKVSSLSGGDNYCQLGNKLFRLQYYNGYLFLYEYSIGTFELIKQYKEYYMGTGYYVGSLFSFNSQLYCSVKFSSSRSPMIFRIVISGDNINTSYLYEILNSNFNLNTCSVVCDDTYAYFVGAYTSGNTINQYDKIVKVNMATGAYSYKSFDSRGFKDAGVIYNDGLIYIFGGCSGYTNDFSDCNRSVICFDINQDKFFALSDLPFAVFSFKTYAIKYEKMAIVIANCYFVSVVYKFCFDTKSFEKINSEPSGVNTLAVIPSSTNNFARSGSVIYVVGNSTIDKYDFSNKSYIYKQLNNKM